MTCTLTNLQVSGWVYLGRQYELCYSKKKKTKQKKQRERDRQRESQSMASTLPVSVNT